jgi:phosphatidylserine/phosphatidylglycerophosphate/cardiolipin synthase-like enzyme
MKLLLLFLLCVPTFSWGASLLDQLREAQSAKLEDTSGWFTPESLARVEAVDYITSDGKSPQAEVLFQYPDQLNTLDDIVTSIKGAQSEILINTYLLTYEPVLSALIHAKYVNRVNTVLILEPLPAARDYRVPQILISNSIATFFCSASGYNYNSYIIIDRSTVYSGFPLTQTFADHSFTGTIFRGRAVAPFLRHFLNHLHLSVNPEIQRVHRSNEDVEAGVQASLLNFTLPNQ